MFGHLRGATHFHVRFAADLSKQLLALLRDNELIHRFEPLECVLARLHLAMTGEPRGFSRDTAGFSNYDGEFRMPLVLAQASPIFHSSCEGKLGIALE